MRRLLNRFSWLGALGAAALWLLAGCGWHHTRKPKSSDRSISEEENDPTYQPDPQRAGEEVRYVQ